MVNLQELEIEKLIDIYRKTNSNEAFEIIFTKCNRHLLNFLLAKKMNVEDAEDLLQNYFVFEFKNSIEKYDTSSPKRFINYIKHIILLRFFSFYKNKKLNKSLIKFSLDENLPNASNITSILKAPVDNNISLIKDEIKDFFRKVLYSIKNENHRNAIIFKLCIPINLSNREIAEIIGCKASVYSTWLYRGILELKAIIKLHDIPFDFDDLNSFIKEESFKIKHDTLNQIKEHKIRKILEQFFFAKEDPQSIAKKIDEPIEEVKSSIQQGIFEVFSLLKNKNLLFRQGGNMSPNKDDVIQFINDIDNISTNLNLRRSSTTGDKKLDSLIISIHLMFNDKKNINKPNDFLSKVKSLGLSIEKVQEKYNLSINELNNLINGNELSDKTLLKIKDILNSNSKSLSDSQFNKLNNKMLANYYSYNK